MGKRKMPNKRTNNVPDCAKSVQIRSFFWSVLSRTRAEYGPGETSCVDTFHAVTVTVVLACILMQVFYVKKYPFIYY